MSNLLSIPGTTSPPTLTTKTVLIVEDEADLSYLIAWVLQEAGYRTDCAHNGAEALAYLERALPDLIVCDLMMPVMTGVELCQAIADSVAYLHIPIIIMSSETDLQTAEGCNYAGRIRKPFDVDNLVGAVHSCIGL